MDESARSPRPRAVWFALFCAVWLAASAAAEGVKDRFVSNGSFEKITRLKAPPKASALGQWALKSDLQAPVGWILSQAFPGRLDVIEGDAAEGERFLRLAAGPKRAAHLYQQCQGLRRGLTYEVALRYRGGPVELKVYEYDHKGRLKADRPFAKGAPTPLRDGPWGTLRGVYRIPAGIAKVCLALAAPEGSEADLDAVRVGRLERTEKWLNVRDFGASGSEFETTADTTAGTKVITLDEAGDFRVGQQVAIARCNPHISDGRVWGRPPIRGRDYFKEQVEARGYDGGLGNWTVYVLDFAGADPPAFRWSDDLGLTWSEKPAPVTGDWQKLSGGVEVKLAHPDFWTEPCVLSFSGRDQLVSTILKIEGSAVTLSDATPIGAKRCKVQHTDSGPLQLAFDRAVGEGRNIFIPSGRYRLTRGLTLRNADGITVEGENEEQTILDIDNGTGACISVDGGTSITIRNLRFHGFSGFDERRQMGAMRTHGYAHMWGFYVKHCNAIRIRTPERLLVENCHATGMSAECFYSSSRSRKGNDEPARYTRSIVYRNCTVVDCARNAFNNNDMAENTAVLYCRVQDVGGCTWEGASRFVKFVGNYVRNAGTVAMGNIRSRDANFDILPSGQHIVAHNTFEQQMVYGSCAIRSSAGSTPVIISNNLFINFNTSAIEANGFGDERNLPSANTIITGNAIDLTCVRDTSRSRFGIRVSADHAIVSDNQIYVRGQVDPRVQGIALQEPARNILVHDNAIRGCEVGLLGTRKVGNIAERIDARTFRSGGGLPWPRRRTHKYRGCRIAWLPRNNASFVLGPEIETFDPDDGLFRLAADCEFRKNARFAVYSPQGFNWNLHHNVINNCTQLVNLDVFGGPTAVFADNLLSRGEAVGVKSAVEIRGLFKIADNQFAGFNELGSVALMLRLDSFGKMPRFLCRDNVFDQCATPVGEGAEGIWKAAIRGGNVLGNQPEAPVQETGRIGARTLTAAPRTVAVFRAQRRTSPPVIDGRANEWAWTDGRAIASLTRTHENFPSGDFMARSLAAYDDQALYLALDISVPAGQTFDARDGVEWSLESAEDKQPTPIYVLWCKADGSLESLTAMGARAAEAARIKSGARYAVAKSAKGWSCEWRVPWVALGVSPSHPPKTWLMNIGVHSAATGTWLVWAPTGGRVCNVGDVGELRLAR